MHAGTQHEIPSNQSENDIDGQIPNLQPPQKKHNKQNNDDSRQPHKTHRFTVKNGDYRNGAQILEGHGTDIASAVSFFCSPAARLISDEIISVDGAAGIEHQKLNLSRT